MNLSTFPKFLSFILFTTALMSNNLFAEDEPQQSRYFIKQVGNMPQGDIDLTTYIGSAGVNGFGLGVLGGMRLTRNGFISKLNNSVSAEGGVFYGSNCWRHSCYSITGHARWDFHIHPMWTAYGAGGFSLGNASVFSNHNDTPVFSPDTKIGAFLRASQDIIIRLEFVPFLFSHRVGVTWILD